MKHLEKFAAAARTKLHAQVKTRLRYALDEDDVYHRERAPQVRELKERVKRHGEAKVIEEAAYLWFNRFVALRFMDVNSYAPVAAVSPAGEGGVLPELLQEAKRGNVDGTLRVDPARINDLLTGRLASANAQDEVYRALLVAECNRRHEQLPFLFEKISDYSELLLPDDLLSERSVLYDLRAAVGVEECKNEEVIGWLYQYYIGEHNGKLIKSKKKYTADELAPASQLFTPRWIVEHMVDNTLGYVLEANFPDLGLAKKMSYFIAPEEPLVTPATPKSIEEITFYDPCVGSGHVLAYAFDLFYMAYERLGYAKSDIPGLILRNNLFGTDIDLRATQLAAFALAMKARRAYRRFLTKGVQPNIIAYRNITITDEDYALLDLPWMDTDLRKDLVLQEKAAVYGSLLRLEGGADAGAIIESISKAGAGDGMFQQVGRDNLNAALTQMQYLNRKYTCVVTNPPYIASSRMEPSLKKYVASHYAVGKSDLFAAFIPRCLELCEEGGYTGFMTPFVWMFISSYQKLREYLIDNHYFNTLIQLEYSGFDGATVPICTFTFRKGTQPGKRGSYIRLSDFKGAKNQAPKTLAAVADPGVDYFYRARQEDFAKIPGGPVGYWLSNNLISVFNQKKLSKFVKPAGGLQTGDNPRFLRYTHEVESGKVNREEWALYHKGGSFQKWYGNQEYVINWYNNGKDIKDHKSSVVRNSQFYFKPFIGWSSLTSGRFAARFLPAGIIMDQKGPGMYQDSDDLNIIYNALGYCNSDVFYKIINSIAPTLDYTAGTIARTMPYVEVQNISATVELLVGKSREACETNETYHKFQSFPLISQGEVHGALETFEKNQAQIFFSIHQLEEGLNDKFTTNQSLSNEITGEIELENITILQNELDRKALAKLNKKLTRDPTSGLVTNYADLDLPFNRKEIMRQLLSYAVGCIMGRYSLDKEGLILANAGDGVAEYVAKVETAWEDLLFQPDEDGIVPLLAGDYFDDDIVGRCRVFLRAAFGAAHYQANVDFVEATVGRSLRDYFVKDFYADHVKRYKKRPIYWLFSSPGKHFQALVYVHRYHADTVNLLLNNYLRDYVKKLEAELAAAERTKLDESLPAGDRAAAAKTSDLCKVKMADCKVYERETLYPLAQRRMALDLDDGVLVNYNRMGGAVLTVSGLNDSVKRKKVEAFDWVEFD
ncbi:BREX-1 system adenine-specific DNA-methyltransferase PglX [Neolewinella antarctica]|uniref:site-specific DNA-methyltransferase (adenine-specific) n=1 Tax=Neolewinella antarctica TaxID=442734 RepID=A0ABX0XH08_9BACT|nr:BREX-1 system adenine-specific DNA-methyltransferase PglX [Neolewinella antarctica]NJC28497.1 type II restriction/modification system DNA methylase subunit YeeA [Neolewinella antarctica]